MKKSKKQRIKEAYKKATKALQDLIKWNND